MPLRRSEVLLLEDNDAHAEMVMLALEGLDHPPKVCRFSNAEDLIEWVDRVDDSGDETEPRFALIDLRLPGKSGLEALARIRQSPQIGKLPVAILTSSREAADQEIADQLGVQAYIIKPIALHQIINFAAHLDNTPPPQQQN